MRDLWGAVKINYGRGAAPRRYTYGDEGKWSAASLSKRYLAGSIPVILARVGAFRTYALA